MVWEVIQWSVGLFITIVGAGWALIQLKFKADEKIVALKDEKVTDIISDIKDITFKLDNQQVVNKDVAQKLAVLVKEVELKFLALDERIKSNSGNYERVTDSLQEFVRAVETRFKNIDYAMNNMQLVKIGKDTYMVKNLRRESQG